MQATRLADILDSPDERMAPLRWRATVPLVSNPFLLVELAQFALAGACIVLVTLCSGIWVSKGGFYIDDLASSLHISGMVFLAVMAGFAGVAFVFFGNRYFATFQIDSDGIYTEGSRGRNERAEWLCLRVKPYPVIGAVAASRVRGRRLGWEKVDRFLDIPAMRVILLQRSRWNMMRLYLPDRVTHDAVVCFLKRQLSLTGDAAGKRNE